MKLSNMKVGAMLGAGFTLVLGLLCIIIAGALVGMADMRERTHQITDVNNQRIELANVLIDTIRNRAIQVRNIALLSEDAAIASQQRAMVNEADTYAKAWKELVPLFELPGTLPEEKAALARVAETMSCLGAICCSSLRMRSLRDMVSFLQRLDALAQFVGFDQLALLREA